MLLSAVMLLGGGEIDETSETLKHQSHSIAARVWGGK